MQMEELDPVSSTKGGAAQEEGTRQGLNDSVAAPESSSSARMKGTNDETMTDTSTHARSRDSKGEETASSYTSIPESHDALKEDSPAEEVSPAKNSERAEGKLSTDRPQDTAYRELGEGNGEAEEQGQEFQEHAAPGGPGFSSPRELQHRSSFSVDAESPAAVDGTDLAAQGQQAVQHALRGGEAKAEQIPQSEGAWASDEQSLADVAGEQQSQGQEEAEREAAAILQDPDENDEEHIEVTTEVLTDSLQPDSKPALEQDHSQAEDSIADAASVLSLDLGGEGTQSLEETSDAESLAAGGYINDIKILNILGQRLRDVNTDLYAVKHPGSLRKCSLCQCSLLDGKG